RQERFDKIPQRIWNQRSGHTRLRYRMRIRLRRFCYALLEPVSRPQRRETIDFWTGGPVDRHPSALKKSRLAVARGLTVALTSGRPRMYRGRLVQRVVSRSSIDYFTDCDWSLCNERRVDSLRLRRDMSTDERVNVMEGFHGRCR